MSSTDLLVPLEDFKNVLQIPSTNRDYDLQLEMSLRVAQQQCEDYTGRFFKPQAQTRHYTACHWDVLQTDDILAVTALRTDDNADSSHETTWSSSAYYLSPYNASLGPSPQPYTRIEVNKNGTNGFPEYVDRGVQVVGTFGYATAVPAVVQQAVIFQAGLSFRMGDAPMGAAGGRDFAQEIQSPMGPGLHPFTRRCLDPYRKRVIG